jgi:hypothetical protein
MVDHSPSRNLLAGRAEMPILAIPFLHRCPLTTRRWLTHLLSPGLGQPRRSVPVRCPAELPGSPGVNTDVDFPGTSYAGFPALSAGGQGRLRAGFLRDMLAFVREGVTLATRRSIEARGRFRAGAGPSLRPHAHARGVPVGVLNGLETHFQQRYGRWRGLPKTARPSATDEQCPPRGSSWPGRPLSGSCRPAAGRCATLAR